jgi:hypothetical protein
MDSSIERHIPEVDTSATESAALEETNRSLRYANQALFAAISDIDHRQYTGNPVITNYRINAEPVRTPNDFSIDVKCLFKFTESDRIIIRLPIIDTITAYSNYHPRSHVQAPADKEIVSTRILTKIWHGIFSPADIDTYLAQAASAEGINEKERLYTEAYQLAKNSTEQVRVLEQMINALGNYHQHIQDMWTLDGNDTKHAALLAQNEEKINQCLYRLPDNYKMILDSIDSTKGQLLQVLHLLKTDSVDEAWMKYSTALPKDSYFLERACPYLAAMSHQLSAVFMITGHKSSLNEHVSIHEHSVMAYVEKEFDSVNKILAQFDADSACWFDEHARRLVKELLRLGEVAKKNTSVSTSNALSEARIQEIRAQRALGVEPTYRDPTDTIDESVIFRMS